MKNFFYKINRKYIDAFSHNVLTRFREANIRSDIEFLRSVLKEVNDLFQRIGGRISSKSDIPKEHEYPNSDKFNRLITNLAFDIDKIYTSQKLIEDDLNNLINFNSTQRIRTFENLTTTQQEVYSTYVKNKTDTRGEITLPAEDPFGSADNISPESEGIYIDERRGILTLLSSAKITKPVALDGVRMFFAGAKPPSKTYPSQDRMGLGSHWKTLTGDIDAHHIDSSVQSDELAYKNMLIDDPDNNYGVGFCEFEGVQTTLRGSTGISVINTSYRISETNEGEFDPVVSVIGSSIDEEAIRKTIGDVDRKDSNAIYVDIPNSLQGPYIIWGGFPLFNFSGKKPQYKLVVPFTQDAPITNQVIITVQPNREDNYPKLNWSLTKVYTNVGGADSAHNVIAPPDSHRIPDNGEYVCNIQGGFIKPARLEAIFEYGGDNIQWTSIGFMMAHWLYSESINYSLPYGDTERITLILGKSYDIYVDAEPNQEKEKQRALNVLLARGQ